MLLLDEKGYINGFNLAKDDKPTPFAISGAKWNGTEWEYPKFDESLIPEKKENLPDEETIEVDAYQFQMLLNGSIYPHGGSYVKEKSTDITVLIPSYKKAEWVTEAVDSALNQTMKPYKVIVLVMTGNDQKALDGIKNPLLQVVKSNQKNASASRNYLVSICPTEYFVFLDADDTLEPDFIEKVYGMEESIVFAENNLSREDHEMGKFRYRFEASIGNLTGLVCKEAWNDVNGLKDDLCNGGEDSFFKNRLFQMGKWKIGYCAEALYNYRRVDGESLTAKTDTFIKSKETELYLSRDWYADCLEKSWAGDYAILQEGLKSFVSAYEKSNGSDELIKIKLTYPCPGNVIRNEINRYWNEHRHLFAESRTRETSCVCNDENEPNLYGRKFDLYVYSNPTFEFDRFKKSSFYVNNPNIDIENDSVESLLKNYCVIFNSDMVFANVKEYIGDDNNALFQDSVYNLSDRKNDKDISRGVTNIVTLVFFMQCNKKCKYCSQKNSTQPWLVDENVLLSNFYEVVDKIESVYGKHWIPQICGGEPTLMSDGLARKVMERLKDYRVTLVTNGNEYGRSIFYSYPNVDAYVHITDKPYDDSFIRDYDSSCVVANHEDLPDIIDAIKRHSLSKDCFFPIYAGTDKRFIMTKKDIAELDRTLSEEAYPAGIRAAPALKLCMTYDRQYKEARVFNKTFVPCCGKGEEEIPIGDWHGQEPSGKNCKGCAMYLWY